MEKPFEPSKFKGSHFEVREDITKRGLIPRKGPTEVDTSGLSEDRAIGDVSTGTTLEILSHFEKFFDEMKGIIDRRRTLESSRRRREIHQMVLDTNNKP